MLEYKRANEARLLEIITKARVKVIEKTYLDSWGNDIYEYDVILFLSADIIGTLSLDQQEQLGEKIRDDLNKCSASIDNMSLRAARLELADEADPDYQSATSFAQQAQTNPLSVSFWTPGHLRLFVSHRDTHKAMARALADSLLKYGVSAFVAHDTIEPMTTWQREIEKGLETMEVMLILVTEDFHSSFWTNQEVGYALGKGVPIIPVKFDLKDPAGFIGATQALKGNPDRIEDSAKDIYQVLAEKLGQKTRLQGALVSAFIASPDFDTARDRFDRMTKTILTLTDEETAQIRDAFASNEALHGAYYLKNHYNRLINFMTRCTGKEFAIDGNELIAKLPKNTDWEMDDDGIPF